MLAAAWFGPQERARATSIGVLSNQLGGALGLLSSVIVTDGSDLPALLGSTAVASGAIFGLLLVGFQAAPPTPPSFSQQAVASTSSSSLRTIDGVNSSSDSGNGSGGGGGGGGGGEYAQLMRHRSFMLLLVAYGIVVGVYCEYYATSDSSSRS